MKAGRWNGKSGSQVRAGQVRMAGQSGKQEREEGTAGRQEGMAGRQE